MNKIVKYQNRLNKIALRKLTDKELNVFFSVICNLKEEGSKEITFNFTELKKITEYKNNDKRFEDNLRSLSHKLSALTQEIIDDDGVIKIFNLFSLFSIDPKDRTLKVKINNEFKKILNELIGNYTKFQLAEIVSFKSSYSKNMYRLLKGFSSTGILILEYLEFRRLLCIPDSYRTGNIDQQVFKPIMEELNEIFPNLKIKKIKKGRKIDKLEFKWDRSKEKKIKEAEEVKEVKISYELEKKINQAKKSRFIQPHLTLANIDILVKKYGDDNLISGLDYARKKIHKEFKYLSYLEKSIETGIEGSNIKLVVEELKQTKSKGNKDVESKVGEKEELTEETRGPKNEEVVRTKISREELISNSKKDGLDIKTLNFTLKSMGYKTMTIEEYNQEEGKKINFGGTIIDTSLGDTNIQLEEVDNTEYKEIYQEMLESLEIIKEEEEIKTKDLIMLKIALRKTKTIDDLGEIYSNFITKIEEEKEK